MTDTAETTHGAEDRLIEVLLDQLDGQSVSAIALLDDELAQLAREYAETLGLLPYALREVPPPLALKRRLLESLGAAEREVGRDRTEAERPPRSGLRRRGWGLPLAAALAVVLLGVSAWQRVRLAQQKGAIKELAGQLSEAKRETARSIDFGRQLEAARDRLALMTSRGVEVCGLYPVDVEPTESTPRGMLFVAGDHRHWYLRIDGLEPCPEGRVYQLWFMKADGSAESGGLLQVESGVRLEVSSEVMPQGAVAVSITLEPAGGSARPTGPSVLYGDDVMRFF